jgi:hypothetical protein
MPKSDHNPYDLNSIAERKGQPTQAKPVPRPSSRPYELRDAQKIAGPPRPDPPKR